MAAQSRQTTDMPQIHLFESVRAQVEQICAEEGATLNEFVNVAVAEKLAHYRHLEWLKQRKTPTDAALAEVLRTFRRRGSSQPPDPGDELPEGYVRDVEKITSVADRLYSLEKKDAITGIKSKQASIVLGILAKNDRPMTIKEVAAEAAPAGLKAIGGVEPSVRYHLHHLTKDGITKVANPTFILT